MVFDSQQAMTGAAEFDPRDRSASAALLSADPAGRDEMAPVQEPGAGFAPEPLGAPSIDRPFLIAAGGTGGHVLPALQVARELRLRGHSCLFVGTERGQERRLVPEAGFAIEFLRIGALKNVSAVRRLQTLWQGPSSLLAAGSILDRTRPRALLSLGGYAAGPLLVMAIMRGTPVLVLEPNAVPGLAHRLAGPFASWALVAFREATRYFHRDRVEIGGIPIREEFFHLPPKPEGSLFTVLITGGSQGARRLNQAAVEALPLLREKRMLGRLRLIHQTGPAVWQQLRAEYEAHSVSAVVEPFIDDMPAAFAEADLIVCRAGASAVAELAAAGKASILIPYPFAADQHQLRNAEAMAAAGAARVVLDRDWNGPRFVEEIHWLMKSKTILETMGKAARGQAHMRASRKAADVLERLAQREAT